MNWDPKLNKKKKTESQPSPICTPLFASCGCLMLLLPGLTCHDGLYSLHEGLYSLHDGLYSRHDGLYSLHDGLYSLIIGQYKVLLLSDFVCVCVCVCVCDIWS